MLSNYRRRTRLHHRCNSVYLLCLAPLLFLYLQCKFRILALGFRALPLVFISLQLASKCIK